MTDVAEGLVLFIFSLYHDVGWKVQKQEWIHAYFFGLGVSVLFGFMRWRFPAVPKPIATFGSAVGVGLLAWSAFPALRWWIAALLIVICSLTLAALDAVFSRSKMQTGKEPKIAVDQSVASTGQSGGITAQNVSFGNVER